MTPTIKGILFDKDGTLVQFDAIWTTVANQLIEEVVYATGDDPDEMLHMHLRRAIGCDTDQIDPQGLLAVGTTEDIAAAFQQVLQTNRRSWTHDTSMNDWVADQMLSITRHNRQRILPTADFSNLFQQLQARDIQIGIATADDTNTTKFYLNELGITHFFDFIGTSDRYPKKPDPSVLLAFCQKYQLLPSEVAVVGDTVTDLTLAKNAAAGLAIGVLTGVGDHDHLSPLADFILQHVGQLVTPSGRLVWEG